MAVLVILDTVDLHLRPEGAKAAAALAKSLAYLVEDHPESAFPLKTFYSCRFNSKSKFLRIKLIRCLARKVDWVSVTSFGLKGIAFQDTCWTERGTGSSGSCWSAGWG